MENAKKEYPLVYVYMLESIDGKASGEVLDAPASKFGKNYYFSHQYSWGSKSILLGRGTFQIFLSWIKADKIDYTGISSENIEKKDYLSENRKKTEYYYITIDKNGKLPFPTGYGNFGGKQECHIITILSEDVDLKYLAYLQKKGVSYIFAGEKNIDLKVALKKLKDLFGIEKIICEGGPTTTQSFLNENLVDKLIILKHPCIAQPGALPVFGNANLSSWSLESFQMLSDKQHLLFVYNKKE
jgi:riboflavin biosynthesis pyrimidine reductase